MASFTGVGDTTSIVARNVGDNINVALSGTYAMVIKFQKEVGSPGSGSWETLATYSTANATVSANFTNTFKDTNYRLIVTTDTSGTCTAVLTETGDVAQASIGSNDGSPVLQVNQSGIESSGGVKSDMVSLTAVIYTLNPRDHANRKLVFNLAAGIDVTLPAATGTGDSYEFFVGLATTDAYLIQASPATDGFRGVICGADADAEFTWAAADDGTDDKIILGGTAQATGGTIGDWVKVTDIAAGSWSVQGFIHQGGSEATPFAAT